MKIGRNIKIESLPLVCTYLFLPKAAFINFVSNYEHFVGLSIVANSKTKVENLVEIFITYFIFQCLFRKWFYTNYKEKKISLFSPITSIYFLWLN